MRALIAAFLLTALAIAAVPPADAKPVPPGPCAEKDYVDGPVHVYTTMGCATFVDVLETECLWGGHWDTVASAGNVYVRYWTCSPEYADMSASNVVPACADFGPKSLLVDVDVTSSCQVVVDEHGHDLFACGGLLRDSTVDLDRAPVFVHADACTLASPPCTCDPRDLFA